MSIRVLIVDDSVVVRRMIAEALKADAEFVVAGTAANGRIALQMISQVNPDVITLDIEMPELDGVRTVAEVRKLYPVLPVIMCSSLTTAGAEATLDALAAGANDWIAKPHSSSIESGIAQLTAELVPRIHALCATTRAPQRSRAAAPRTAAPLSVPAKGQTPLGAAASNTVARRPGSRAAQAEIIAIGTSTGGPNALADLFKGLNGPLSLPIVIVQHMPPVFTKSLAERLDRASTHRVYEAEQGQTIEPGSVYIAPGGHHLEVERSGVRLVARLTSAPPENSCRPAVDVLFRSVAKLYGSGVLACVMTGMGQDGLRGCENIRAAGGQIVVQDEATSVVWGMPGAVANAGLADEVLPLNAIAGALTRRAGALALSRC